MKTHQPVIWLQMNLKLHTISNGIRGIQAQIWDAMNIDKNRLTIIRFVMRTDETLVLNSAIIENSIAHDPYITSNQVKSIMCVPIKNQNRRVALLYLENNLSTGVFSDDRKTIVQNLGSQIALLIQNIPSEKVVKTDEERNKNLEEILREEFKLTPQETNIAILLKNGKTRDEISQLLTIAKNTMRNHLGMIYDKTINLRDDIDEKHGRVDKLSQLFLFLFELERSPHQ